MVDEDLAREYHRRLLSAYPNTVRVLCARGQVLEKVLQSVTGMRQSLANTQLGCTRDSFARAIGSALDDLTAAMVGALETLVHAPAPFGAFSILASDSWVYQFICPRNYKKPGLGGRAGAREETNGRIVQHERAVQQLEQAMRTLMADYRKAHKRIVFGIGEHLLPLEDDREGSEDSKQDEDDEIPEDEELVARTNERQVTPGPL